MPGRVADASVLAAIAYQEPEAEFALSLVHGADLYEPNLLVYELANIARTKILRDAERQAAILMGLRTLLRTTISWVNIDAAALVDASIQAGLTAYDAAYLETARSLGIDLVTFDGRLAEAARKIDRLHPRG